MLIKHKKGYVGGIVIALFFVATLFGILICTERIPVGYEGVVYSMNGGVQEETLTQGWHIVSPTKKVKCFAISEEQLNLVNDKGEAFQVSTSDNAGIEISFQMSYHFVSDKIVDTYSKFRGMDGEDVINNRVKTVLKSKISEVTAKYSMMDIYSGSRSTINRELTDYLNNEFKKSYGLEVTSASIVDVHPDEQLQNTINERVSALQRKQQAEAEQETIRVEAETKKIQAQAEADAAIIAAQAEADAYRIKSSEITENLLKKWELDARREHGWVTIQGANAIVTGQ